MIFCTGPRFIRSCSNHLVFYDRRRHNGMMKYFTHILASNNAVFIRKCSSLERQEPKVSNIINKFGRVQHIYAFPYISYSNIMINMKYYALPVVMYFIVNVIDDAIEGDLDATICSTMLISCFLVALKSNLVGLPFVNFVAHIYISPECEVILSYVTFWGLREDEKFPKGDLFLKSRETGSFRFVRKDSFYMLLVSRSTKKVFRINFKFCDMFDEELFRLAIGHIPESAVF